MIKFLWAVITLAIGMIASPHVFIKDPYHQNFSPEVRDCIEQPDSVSVCILGQPNPKKNTKERVAMNRVILQEISLDTEEQPRWEFLTKQLTDREDYQLPNIRPGNPTLAVRFKKAGEIVDVLYCPTSRNVYFVRKNSVRPFFARDFRSFKKAFMRLSASVPVAEVTESHVAHPKRR